MTMWCPTKLVEQKSDKWNSKTICIVFFPRKHFQILIQTDEERI